MACDVGDLRGRDDAGNFEIALGGGAGADADGSVGQVQVGGIAIGLAEDDHRLDAQIAAGADDPQGDLAAIGYENALKHSTHYLGGIRRRNKTCPGSLDAQLDRFAVLGERPRR